MLRLSHRTVAKVESRNHWFQPTDILWQEHILQYLLSACEKSLMPHILHSWQNKFIKKTINYLNIIFKEIIKNFVRKPPHSLYFKEYVESATKNLRMSNKSLTHVKFTSTCFRQIRARPFLEAGHLSISRRAIIIVKEIFYRVDTPYCSIFLTGKTHQRNPEKLPPTQAKLYGTL